MTDVENLSECRQLSPTENLDLNLRGGKNLFILPKTVLYVLCTSLVAKRGSDTVFVNAIGG